MSLCLTETVVDACGKENYSYRTFLGSSYNVTSLARCQCLLAACLQAFKSDGCGNLTSPCSSYLNYCSGSVNTVNLSLYTSLGFQPLVHLGPHEWSPPLDTALPTSLPWKHWPSCGVFCGYCGPDSLTMPKCSGYLVQLQNSIWPCLALSCNILSLLCEKELSDEYVIGLVEIKT